MQINYIKNIASTHQYLLKQLREKKIKTPCALYANNQFGGIGSRNNSWIGEEGNLYLSFALGDEDLASDIPKPSICIYFATLMQDLLANKGSKVWLKWPNDFYLGEKKIGGIMSTKIGDFYVVSMGINLLSCPQNFATLDIDMSNHELVRLFCDELKKKYSWKQVFSKFRIQFKKNENFTFHLDDKICSLSEAKLCEDGSIIINKKRVYNLR